ncbi:site-specific integrase [Mangrovitalea sediminis]|uniref:site-specific integrase n=1 Tax=Mangrovitalea sediminis TaxID=1982043 RepID=UPI001178C331|nr:site-specific integrase [Mangrovitalea sediminis]
MRLVSGKQVTPEVGEDETGNVDYLTPPPVKCHPILGDQLQAFKELCRVIYRKEQGGSVTKTPAELLSDLKKFVSRTDLSPILQLLTAWAIHLVRDGGMVKSRLAPSSVVRYLHWVGRELIIHSPDLMAPETLDADEWQAIYEVCIAKSKSSSGNVTARLAEFHRFLEAHYGVPPVDLGAHGGKRQVDARLLTPREYLRVRQLIRKSGDTVLTDIQELVLILGYRCGLRRGEVWSRLLADFPGLDHPRVQRKELLVRPNKISGIKSWAGTRRLPLSLLLQEDELEVLTAFYRKRKAELVERAGNQALFSVDGLSGLPADQKLVFDTITACLRKVTGDPAFRFHHLRHSFVSLTFLRLMETYPGEHVPQDWRQGRGGAALLPSMQAPLWQSAGLSDTRRSAWLLGQWAGHASPGEAMLSYSHLLDWLTRSYLWRPARGHDLSRSEQCVLLDKSQAAIEQFRYRQGLNDRTISAQQLCDLVVHQWPKTAIKPLPAGRWSEPSVPDPVTVIGYRPERHYRCAYDLAWRALEKVPGFDGNYRPRGVEGAAQMLDVSLNDAQRWHRNAIHLMSMKSTRQTSGFYYDEQGQVIEQRARLSTGAPGVKRSLDEKDFQKGLPELPTFIAPPRGEIGRQSAAKWYEKLLGWHSSAPKEANACMTSVLEHAQRSRARIKTRSVQSHQMFCRLLQRVGLESSIRVRVHLSASTPQHVALKHWAKTLAVREKAITVKVFDDDQRRLGSFGKSHVFVDPPKAFHGKLDRFWSPFRFAVMSALVVTGDLVSAETQKEASVP